MTYLKADKKQVKYKITLPHDLLSLTHTQGKRWVLQKVTATFSEALEKLRWRVFEGVRETFLIHQLKKLLSTEARKQLRKNLTDFEAIVYSDFSHCELESRFLAFPLTPSYLLYLPFYFCKYPALL